MIIYFTYSVKHSKVQKLDERASGGLAAVIARAENDGLPSREAVLRVEESLAEADALN